MSKRRKNKNKYKYNTYTKPKAYSSSNSADIQNIAFKVFGSLYYTCQKES